MAVRVICFYQPGCMGCMEQTPINREVEKNLAVTIEEIDAVKNPQLIRQYGLKVTPTIVILVNDVVKERLEGVVHAEQLEATLKKYL
jgi:thioredoxin 1